VKRIFVLLSVLASCLAVYFLFASGATSRAQTVTDEVGLRLLPVPTNVIGTTIRGVSNDGKRIVLDSINDYNGKNVDSNTEIYVYDVDSRSVIQITDTADIKDPADNTKTLFRINNVTPKISGDGTKIVFLSNADLAGATNEDRNYEIYLASLPRNSTEVSISRITDTEKNKDNEVVKEIFNNFSPGINDDGSVITFVSTRRAFKPIDGGAQAFSVQDEGENPEDTNPTAPPRTDGNGEIFMYNVAAKSFTQVTLSRDREARVNFADKGFNTAPIPSGDGRTLAFVSAFNHPGPNANKNSDFNGEIFIYRVGDPMNTFTQVTDTTGAAVVPLATILPNLTVFYSLNQNAPMNIMNSVTHPLSSDGTLLTFESAGNFTGANADKTREVWLYNVNSKAFTQVTNFSLPNSNPSMLTQEQLKKIDFNFMPSINSTGSHISFGSTSNITPASSSSVKTDNADGSREFFRYDIAAQKFRQVTFADKTGGPLEQDAVGQPYIDNTGSAITFSFLANRLATNASAVDDLFQAVIRPVTANSGIGAAMANAASFKTDQIARGSLVAVFGLQLANNTVVAPSTNLPFDLGGVTVTVNGVAARLILVSSGQINMVLPLAVANADNVDFTINNNGVLSTGKITKIVDAAPGVFTATSDGAGRTIAQCARVSPDGLTTLITLPPCSVGTELQPNSLVIFGTGWRNVSSLQVKIGDQTLTPTFSGAQPNFAGLDQINVTLTKELANKPDLDVSVVIPATTPVESNKSQTSFLPIEVAITMTLNAASFEAGTVARSSIAIAQGMNLSNDTVTVPGPVFPTVLNGVTVTVAGLPALITSISPTQVNFILPDNIAPADLVEVLINNNGAVSRGRVKVQDAAPGIFTTTGDGAGTAVARCGRVNPDTSITFTDPPCSIGPEGNRNVIRIFCTGWRNANPVTLKIGDTELTTTFDGGLPGVPGTDIIEARLDPALAGKTDLDAIITAKVGDKTFTSKAGIKVSFTSN
jgi:uncharacterized protein (TIGR03437 family)